MFRPLFNASLRTLARPTPATQSLRLKAQLTAFRCLSTEARATIQKAIESKPVVLFMKGTPDAPQCGFSRAAVQVLDLHGVPPEKMQTYNVLADEELRSGIKEFSEWPTIPQIYVNGEFIGGCDLLLGMHQSGELETLLEDNNVIPKVSTEEPAQKS